MGLNRAPRGINNNKTPRAIKNKTPRAIKNNTPRAIKNNTPPAILRMQVNVRTPPEAKARTTRGLRVVAVVAGPAEAEATAKVGAARGTGVGGAVGAHVIKRVEPIARTAAVRMMAEMSRSN